MISITPPPAFLPRFGWQISLSETAEIPYSFSDSTVRVPRVGLLTISSSSLAKLMRRNALLGGALSNKPMGRGEEKIYIIATYNFLSLLIF